MSLPFHYHAGELGTVGGLRSLRATFDSARAVVVPVPLERTSSSGSGTRYGPREILLASARLEAWDEEMECDIAQVGIFTMPEMTLPFASLDDVLADIPRVTTELVTRDKFPVFLGGEHSITGPIVAAMAQRYSGLTVLQIDAHAELRDQDLGTPHSHACTMRRALEFARATQVGIRSLSPEEAAVAPMLPTEIFYDFDMRGDPHWIERVVDSLSATVYITIDVDGLDPSIMPATHAPEPGGLRWYELLMLLRRVMESRRVVGCDIVELAPMTGWASPNLLCAKLVYKVLGYRFGKDLRRRLAP